MIFSEASGKQMGVPVPVTGRGHPEGKSRNTKEQAGMEIRTRRRGFAPDKTVGTRPLS